ncbi:MAG: hypothetical protein PUB08_04565 [Firmicutes bacterium]|nr:hypothetical protein [Bacillota bacterium]
MKKSKFILGITLIVQSFSCFIMFIHFYSKRKDLARTFFALGLVGGLASAYAFYCDYTEKKEFDALAHDYCYGDDADCYADDSCDCMDGLDCSDFDDINIVLPDEKEDSSADAE